MLPTIRPLAESDDLHALTALLNRAYSPLAAAGMNFTAADQTVEKTRERIEAGDTWVALDAAGAFVGTVTLSRPRDPRLDWVQGHAWIAAPDIAHINQLAVEPGLQRGGLGRRLMDTAEAAAQRRGVARILLDTAEPATPLRAWYERLGYRTIGVDRWPGKTYRSVIMEKSLPASPLKAHLLTMARYNAWATERLLRHVDALSDDEYRRDTGLFFKSVHGTLNHLRVTEQLLWFRRFAEGVSPRLALDAEVEPERAALRQRLIEGAALWPRWLAEVDDARLAGMLEYTNTRGIAASVPVAATLGHVFNHSSHHRGQITAVITALGHACPEIDLAVMLLQERARPAPPEARTAP